ncbi:MAG: restriction endonuclease subunit S [Planctomycetaceae bacterium]
MSKKLPARSETAPPPPAATVPAVEDGDLPEGWAVSTIGMCFLDVRNGATATQNKDRTGIPVSRIETIQNCRFDMSRVQHLKDVDENFVETFRYLPGDIAFSHINSFEHVGKTALYDGIPECFIHGMNLLRLRLGHTCIDPRFAHLYMQTNSFREEVRQRVGHAVNQVSINQKNLAEVPIVVSPLAEQRRIVGVLEGLLGKVAESRERLSRVPQLLKRFRQSVLAAACSGKLTADWREENQEDDWQYQRADEVCDAIQSGSTPKADLFQKDGVPFLKVYNIVNQTVSFNYRPQFVSSETHRTVLKRATAIPGDVLMNIVGPPLGKVAVVPADYPEWSINQAIVLFRPSQILDHRFLYVLLCSSLPYAEILDETRGSAGQSNISLSQCRAMMLPTPSLAEQHEIVRRVEQLFALADRLEAQLETARKRVERLTQSILAKAFRGELVPTEAELARRENRPYEPASELLARIRQQSAAAVTSPKTRKPRKSKGGS